jgi:hypothetical protein
MKHSSSDSIASITKLSPANANAASSSFELEISVVLSSTRIVSSARRSFPASARGVVFTPRRLCVLVIGFPASALADTIAFIVIPVAIVVVVLRSKKT